jgi:hypothetical protein
MSLGIKGLTSIRRVVVLILANREGENDGFDGFPDGSQCPRNASCGAALQVERDWFIDGPGVRCRGRRRHWGAARATVQTGTTADRLSLNPSAANAFQRPPPQLAFLDTTLAAFCWYVGVLSATGWVNQLGAAV